jgi:hypothetical protein
LYRVVPAFVKKAKLIHLYGQIERRDDEARIVEGYVYVNEDVGDGRRLSRAAMEAATEDYMRWGAVREMHGANAAGTANDGGATPGLGVTWDERGAFFRCKVVDDAAWEKVKGGVYKGFSVGVRPMVVRGDTVTKCTWVESSLVDRPKDWDSRLTIARADGYDGTEEFEVDVERGSFADVMPAVEKHTLRREAMRVLDDLVWTVLNDPQYTDKATAVREAFAEAAEYIVGVIERGEFPETGLSDLLAGNDAAAETLVRLETTLVERGETVERLEAELAGRAADVERLEGEALVLRSRVEELEAMPDPGQARPLKVTAKNLVERAATIAEEQADATDQRAAKIRALVESAAGLGHDDRLKVIAQIQRLKLEPGLAGVEARS